MCVSAQGWGGRPTGNTPPTDGTVEPHYQLQCGCKPQYVVSQLTKGRDQRLN